MQIYAVQLICKIDGRDPFIIKGAYNPTKLPAVAKKEYMDFVAETVVAEVSPGSPSSLKLKQQENICHAYVLNNGLAAVCITDLDYPRCEAYTLLEKLLADFQAVVPESIWEQPPDTPGAENELVASLFPQLDRYFARHLNRQTALIDKMLMDIDETKVHLLKGRATLLKRAEDEAIAAAVSLSNCSTMFKELPPKIPRKSRCCTIL